MFTLTAILGVCALIVASSIWSGYALSILWAWFMAPIFGLGPLSIPAAIGVALVVRFLVHQYRPNNTGDAGGMEAFFHAFIVAFLHPAITLLFGWIVKQYL